MYAYLKRDLVRTVVVRGVREESPERRNVVSLLVRNVLCHHRKGFGGCCELTVDIHASSKSKVWVFQKHKVAFSVEIVPIFWLLLQDELVS